MTEENSPKETKQRVFKVEKDCFVTNGYYRNKVSFCSYYIDCDVLGRMYMLDDITDVYTKAKGTYFNEKWVSFNIR